MTDYAALDAAMGPGENGRDPLDVSGVRALTVGCDLADVAAALRRLALLLPAHPLDRRVVRGQAIAALKEAKVADATGLVDAALPGDAADADALQGQAVALEDPAPWPDPVDGAALLDTLARTFTAHIALVDGAAVALALWTLHAHAHAAAAVSPLLALTSPEKRSGKTTTLTLLGALVPRPLTAANISPAALFRTVERYAPSILLDEADTVFRVSDELRCLFNASHTRAAAHVVRVVGDALEPRLFSTWGPKALALIGDLPGTLEDRALVVPMRRRRPEEQVAKLRLDRLGEFAPLCRQAWRWAQEHREALTLADPAMPETLHDRAADNWRPLLAIADAAGGPWPARARRAAILLSGGVTEGEQAPAVQLLADVRDLFRERGVERIASADIVAALTLREDRPWPEWYHGRPLTVRQLAKLLGRFGVSPKVQRLGEATARGYQVEQFGDAFARYLPSDPLQALQPNRGAAKPTFDDPLHALRVTDAKSTENPRGDSLVADVTDGKGEPAAGRGDAWEAEAAAPPALTVTDLGAGLYLVSGGAEPHEVRLDAGSPTCDCADHAYRRHECKHILAVRRQASTP